MFTIQGTILLCYKSFAVTRNTQSCMPLWFNERIITRQFIRPFIRQIILLKKKNNNNNNFEAI